MTCCARRPGCSTGRLQLTGRITSTCSTSKRSSVIPTRRPPCGPISTRWTPASWPGPPWCATRTLVHQGAGHAIQRHDRSLRRHRPVRSWAGVMDNSGRPAHTLRARAGLRLRNEALYPRVRRVISHQRWAFVQMSAVRRWRVRRSDGIAHSALADGGGMGAGVEPSVLVGSEAADGQALPRSAPFGLVTEWSAFGQRRSCNFQLAYICPSRRRG
jgi:hypothetical protein